MYHSARWKAYQLKIEETDSYEREEDDIISGLFHTIKSQCAALFTEPEDNGHQAAAEEHLKRSTELLMDCTRRMDALEETLANTPKPSEALNWSMMTLGDFIGE